MAKLPVTLNFNVIDKASKAIQGITSKLHNLNKTADMGSKKISNPMANVEKSMGRMKNLAGQVATVGAGISAAITVPITAAGLSMIDNARKFEVGLADLGGRTDITGDKLKTLGEEARRLGVNTVFGFEGAIEGMTELGKAGFKYQEIMDSTLSVMNLAAAEGISVGEAAAMANDTLNIFGKKAKDTTDVVDMLSKAAGESSISIRDLQNSMKYAAPNAAKLHVPIEQITGAIAALGGLGIKGEMGGTALRSFMDSITGDAKRIERLKEAGISGDDLFVDGDVHRMKPLVDVFEALSKAKMTDIQLTKIFGKEHGSAISLLINNNQKLRDVTKAVSEEYSGFTQKLADLKTNTFDGAMKKMQNAWKDLGVSLAEGGENSPLAALTKFILIVRDLIVSFNGLPTPIKNFIYIMAGLTAVLLPIVTAIAGIAFGFLGMKAALLAMGVPLAAVVGTMGTVAAAVLAIGAAVGFLIWKWDELALGAKIIWTNMKTWAQEFFDFSNLGIDKLLTKFQMLASLNPITAAGRFAGNFFTGLKNMVSGPESSLDYKPTGSSNSELMGKLLRPEEFIKGGPNEAKARVRVDFMNTPFGTTIEQAKTLGGTVTPLEIGINGRTPSKSQKQRATGGGRR